MNSLITHSAGPTFEADVLNFDLPVLVDFWAPWCGPCLRLAPALEKLATDYEGRLKVVKVNVNDDPKGDGNLSALHGVRGIPALLLFKDGAVVDRMVGADPSRLRFMVEEQVGKAAAQPTSVVAAAVALSSFAGSAAVKAAAIERLKSADVRFFNPPSRCLLENAEAKFELALGLPTSFAQAIDFVSEAVDWEVVGKDTRALALIEEVPVGVDLSAAMQSYLRGSLERARKVVESLGLALPGGAELGALLVRVQQAYDTPPAEPVWRALRRDVNAFARSLGVRHPLENAAPMLDALATPLESDDSQNVERMQSIELILKHLTLCPEYWTQAEEDELMAQMNDTHERIEAATAQVDKEDMTAWMAAATPVSEAWNKEVRQSHPELWARHDAHLIARKSMEAQLRIDAFEALRAELRALAPGDARRGAKPA